MPSATNSRVAVVGASGFVGRHVAAYLVALGYDVIALSRKSAPIPSVNSICIDFNDEHVLQRALCDATAVVHVAGLAHVTIADAQRAQHAYRLANSDLVATVARAAVATSAQKYVLLSSAGVLGKQSPTEGFTLSSPPAPYDEYTRSKLAGETALVDALAGSRAAAVILRPPMIYGPRAPGTFHRILQWLRKGRPVPLGGVASRRSTIGIRNLCAAIEASIRTSHTGVRLALIADSEALAVGAFCHEMAKWVPGARVWRVPQSLLHGALFAAGAAADHRRLFGNFELSTTETCAWLGWRAPHSVSEEIAYAICGC